jgi:hypothetical protein
MGVWRVRMDERHLVSAVQKTGQSTWFEILDFGCDEKDYGKTYSLRHAEDIEFTEQEGDDDEDGGHDNEDDEDDDDVDEDNGEDDDDEENDDDGEDEFDEEEDYSEDAPPNFATIIDDGMVGELGSDWDGDDVGNGVIILDD